MSERLETTLADRTKILLINMGLFYVAFRLASGNWLPTGGLESIWLLSALALWFLSMLSAPWFVPPRDALANAIGATCILVTADLSGVGTFRSELEYLRWIGAFFCVAIAIFALVSLFVHDRDRTSAIGRMLFRFTATFGRAELFYTPAALISILGAYQSSFPVIAWLLILWTFIIFGRLTDRFYEICRHWQFDLQTTKQLSSVGSIERIDDPNIVRVKLRKREAWQTGKLHVAAMSDGEQHFVIGLFSQTQGTEVMGTGLCVAKVAETELIDVPSGYVYAAHDQQKTDRFIENLSGTPGSELIGFTVEGSTIGTMRFEIAASLALAEGDVVFTKIAGSEVFYQILDAETSEETFDQNPRGTHIVRAAQLGCFDSEKGFTKYPWLPTMNTPLFYAKSRTFPPSVLSKDEFIIGNVPSTNIGVAAKIEDLVQYHTAILGVTGTGKTELALDIVREAVSRGVKVFCVDFTGEYRARLSDLNPIFPAPSPQSTEDLATKLFAAETGAYGAGKEKQALDEALRTMRAGTKSQITDFLISEKHPLAVFELAEISNSKATLRLTELYLSAIMDWAKNHRKARQVLIVLEEAHTIIPEVFGAGFDYDTQWVVSRIGQIALQGRKYGVGLLIVSQRTALVSKTILSQCNTFLTHSLIDQTSLNFLDSVYSSQHTRTIPNLGLFEFLAFGKALRAERPILLKRPFDPKKQAASAALNMSLPASNQIAVSDPVTIASEPVAYVQDRFFSPDEKPHPEG